VQDYTTKDWQKSIAVPVAGLFVLLLAGSAFFYKERMLFVDPGWVVFNIVNTKTFLIAEHRYGAVVTQIVPLAGVWLRLPLSLILFAYSVSFQLFYLIAALLLLFRYRQAGLAVLMALYFTLIVSDEYFWPNNEVHQGIAWMFLFLGLYRWKAGSPGAGHHLLLLLFGFLAIFSHFLVILPFSFLWLYPLAGRQIKKPELRTYLIYTVFLAVVFLAKYYLGSTGWYDGPKLHAVRKMDIGSILRSFAGGQAGSMYKLLLVNYWLVPLLLVISIAGALRYKYYGIAFLTLAYALGYFALVCLTYPDATTRGNLFYMESEWMGLAVIAGAAWVYIILPKVKPAYASLALTIVFTIRLIYIGASVPLFHERLMALQHTIDELRARRLDKAILVKNERAEEAFVMSWGLATESLICSSMDGGQPVTFKLMPENEIGPVAADTFLSCFSREHYKMLNPAYFRIDTQRTYQVLRYEALYKGENK